MPASHYLRPVLRTTAPHVLAAVAFDPVDGESTGSGYHTSAGSWSVRVARRRGRGWRPVPAATRIGTDAAAVWSALATAAGGSGRVYVVTPVASDTVTLLDLWGRVESGLCSLRLAASEYTDAAGKKHQRRPHPLVLSGVPDVIGWHSQCREFRAVSSGNHLPFAHDELARLIGHPPCEDARRHGRPAGHTDPDSSWTTSLLLAAYQRVIGWWIDAGAGRWSDTLGSMGWQWWRTTVTPRTVLVHDVPGALAQEGAAVRAGRAQLFWFGSAGRDDPKDGDTPAPDPARPQHLDVRCWKIDIRSMYVHLMATRQFPTILSGRLRCGSVQQLEEACRTVLVLATVRVRVATPSLPYSSIEKGVVYPVGEWTTTLATPELVAALSRGEVTEVYEVWSYRPGRPFQEFAESLLTIRTKAIASGDTLSGKLSKQIGNALSGRLAAHGRGWRTEPDRVCRRQWGAWSEIDADTGETARLRGVCGVRQRLVVRPERPGGLTACYAHLTSYGRVRLAGIMAMAGRREVLWCDTDGLIVTAAGLAEIRAGGERMDASPGELRVESEVCGFTGRTPRHYHASGLWTLAGTRDDFGIVDRQSVRAYQSANPVRRGATPHAAGLPCTSHVYRVDSIPLSGVPGADGWLIPPVVIDGRLVQPTDELPDELRDWDYS